MELNEEEKKAIERLKDECKAIKIKIPRNYPPTYSLFKLIEDTTAVQCLINLVEKQQKEINREKQYSEFYKDLCNKQQKEIEKLKKENGLLLVNNNGYFDLKKYIKNNYISKDKIREKMREIMGYTFTTNEERHSQDYAYDRLKELLEDD